MHDGNGTTQSATCAMNAVSNKSKNEIGQASICIDIDIETHIDIDIGIAIGIGIDMDIDPRPSLRQYLSEILDSRRLDFLISEGRF